jgi:(S)-ureidoglycine aminohydrolase
LNHYDQAFTIPFRMTANLLYGDTRTKISARHALIGPDSHVPSCIPGIEKAAPVVLISPGMGAHLTQVLITFQEGGAAVFAADAFERFAYVVGGSIRAEISGDNHVLAEGGFLFAPAGQSWRLGDPTPGAQVNLFVKKYVALAGTPPPPSVVGKQSDIGSTPFMGDETARLQFLLPDTLSFDMGVNIFNYESGTHLPLVETHIMEHGLLMLEGKGIYRLEDSWYPVAAGDCIWMAPYCPQWFVAMGATKSRYLYYKDINRAVEE